MSNEKQYAWHKSARDYLARLGESEYRTGLAQHVKKKRKAATYRYNPSQYHRDLIDALNDDDENRFKAIKMLEGYASDLGV